MEKKRIGCIADDSPKAQEALRELVSRYELIDMSQKRTGADVIVVLGGDGFMLQVLHRFMERKNALSTA